VDQARVAFHHRQHGDYEEEMSTEQRMRKFHDGWRSIARKDKVPKVGAE
jgi:hypothetical protein